MFLFAFFKLGEVVLILLAMIFMLAAFLAIPGAIIFIIWRGRKNRAAWREISQKLNLQLTRSGRMPMTGVYNDCHVKLSIGVRKVGYGENSSQENFTYCQIKFPNPLRLLLKIERGQAGSKNIALGQANFDKNFAARCYDAKLLQSFLLTDFHSDKTQNLMGDLMWAKDAFDTVEITDKKVYVEKSGIIDDLETMKKLLDVTTHLAKRFFAARKNLPPAEWEKQTLSNWQNLANVHNLSLDPDNFILQGNYGKSPVFIALETEKEKWQTEIKLRFPKSLMAGLKIMPDNAIHKALSWLGMQDIESGNKAFDDAFIVKAKNETVARHKLQPDLCTHLLNFNSIASNILITDEEISMTFDTVLGDEKTLKSYLEALGSTAQMLLR